MHISPLTLQPNTTTPFSKQRQTLDEPAMPRQYMPAQSLPPNRSSSSQFPSTPPPLMYHRSPYACVPLPSQLDTPGPDITIHPMITYTTAPTIHYDLSNPPPTPSQLGARGQVLHEPATLPPLPSLSLLIPQLPWPITVHASSIRGGVGVVSILDVLAALYHALQLPTVGDDEEALLAEAPKSISAHRPCVSRRIQYLGTRTQFLGMSQSTACSDTTIVHVR